MLICFGQFYCVRANLTLNNPKTFFLQFCKRKPFSFGNYFKNLMTIKCVWNLHCSLILFPVTSWQSFKRLQGFLSGQLKYEFIFILPDCGDSHELHSQCTSAKSTSCGGCWLPGCGLFWPVVYMRYPLLTFGELLEPELIALLQKNVSASKARANQEILCTAVGDFWGLLVNLFAENVVNFARNPENQKEILLSGSWSCSNCQ